MRKAFITGLAGTCLSDEEKIFLARERPAGLIVFSRNIESPEQLTALIASGREAIGADDVLVLIDQEGGRVQRLRPPYWRELPPARSYAQRYQTDAAAAKRAACLIAQLTAYDLRALGINVNCVPCIDVPADGAHDIIGTRAYGNIVGTIIDLATVVAEANIATGVLPVIKHIPGHGRAMVDSHLALPVVNAPKAELARTDFATFRAMNSLPAAMTAHVVYTDIDADRPATTSRTVIRDIVRGDIGFSGLVMSDDLSMQALEGTMSERTIAAVVAGCDLALHCNGDYREMLDVAAAVPILRGEALKRFERCAEIVACEPFPLDIAAAEAALADHMRQAVVSKGNLH